MNETVMSWAKEFLHTDHTFVDFGTGNYITLYKEVCNVVEIKDEVLDDLNLKLVCFVNVLDKYAKVRSSITTLNLNRYPPLVYTFSKTAECICFEEWLENLGYTIYPVSGYKDIHLASDHPHFVINPISTSTQLDDMSVSDKLVYYKGLLNDKPQSDIGLIACDFLIYHGSDTDRNIGMINLYNYMEKLPFANRVWLDIPHPSNRTSNNPSLISITGGYLCNIRYSNYIYIDTRNFRWLDSNEPFNTSDHYLVWFDYDFNIIKTHKILDKTGNRYYKSFVEGIDDLRLITPTSFVCSHGNFNNRGLIEQCFGTLNEDGDVVSLKVLVNGSGRHEKNWLPFIKDDQIHLIYQLEPLTIYKVTTNRSGAALGFTTNRSGEALGFTTNRSGAALGLTTNRSGAALGLTTNRSGAALGLTPDCQLQIVKNVKISTSNLNGFRGSAPPIKFESQWLFTVHHVSKDLDYTHRFALMDDDFNAVRISQPFYFEKKGIEFSLGMCWDPDNNLLITHSVYDQYARVITVTRDTIQALFSNDKMNYK